MIITALRDLANVKTCAPLALPYYFFKEKMEFLGQSPSLEREGKPCGAGTDTEDMWQTEGGVFRPWGHAERPAILPVRTSRSMCCFRSRKMRENGRRTGGQTGRQYGQILSNRFWKSGKVQYLFLHNLPGKKKMNNTWQYLGVANGSVHESSCSWTNKNIGDLKMMAVKQSMPDGVKKEQEGLFWMLLFFHESDRYTF